MTLLDEYRADAHWSNPQRLREAAMMRTKEEKLKAIGEAVRTLTEAASDLRTRIDLAELRPGTDRVSLVALRSVLDTYETHARALGRLLHSPPNPLRTEAENEKRLEDIVALNMTAMAMCERRHEKTSPDLAAPLHRAEWGLNRAFSPT